jgi:hypothetical protein
MKALELAPNAARFVRQVYGIEVSEIGGGHGMVSEETAKVKWPDLMAESGIEGVSKAFDRAGINHRIRRF